MMQLTMPHYFSIIVLTVDIIHAQINLAPMGTASQSSTYGTYNASLAIAGPATHVWTDGCSHTDRDFGGNWWKIEFESGYMFFTNVIIYYRDYDVYRMDGFSLYVTNSSLVGNPPVGYLCYRDKDPDYPNIYQNISCYAVGKNIIFYNDRYTFIELCYVETYGCAITKWGTNCTSLCSSSCVDQHCFPENSSCVFGCTFCMDNSCDADGTCASGCRSGRSGQYCDKDFNLALTGSVSQHPSSSQTSLVIDGLRSSGSCTVLNGPDTWLQVDLRVVSLVTAIYFNIKAVPENSPIWGHRIFGSNSSQSWHEGLLLYHGAQPNRDIDVFQVFRYLIYVPPQTDPGFNLQMCEVEVIGCPFGKYGNNCDKTCSLGCVGTCHLDTGICLYGCKSGWIGEKCDQVCSDGTYGIQCVHKCSTNCFSPPCNQTTGKCDNGGCIKGWEGINCTTACSQGYYGFNCFQSCDGCLYDQCNRFDGICQTTNKCKPGWKLEPKCQTPCDDWNFGNNCVNLCNCLNVPCVKSTGKCPEEECKKGWKGDACNEECSIGYFGFSCNQSCHGCIENACDRFDGLCTLDFKCKPGWKYGPKCNIECENMYYGDNCSMVCACGNKPCDKDTGECRYDKYDQEQENKAGAIGGGAVAAVVVLILAVVAVIFIRRRQNNEKQKQVQGETSNITTTNKEYTGLCVKRKLQNNEEGYMNFGESEDHYDVICLNSTESNDKQGGANFSTVVKEKNVNDYETENKF